LCPKDEQEHPILNPISRHGRQKSSNITYLPRTNIDPGAEIGSILDKEKDTPKEIDKEMKETQDFQKPKTSRINRPGEENQRKKKSI